MLQTLFIEVGLLNNPNIPTFLYTQTQALVHQYSTKTILQKKKFKAQIPFLFFL